MICQRYRVSGRVQGVFYRASCQRLAVDLGLQGWVRNLHDGRVEALACGEPDQLQNFENWLKIGPEHAKVTNIEIMQENNVETFSSFSVKPTASTGK